MKRFTTPCFVRVEDAEERKKLMDWLSQLGYDIRDVYWNGCIRIVRCWTSPKGIDRAVGYPCKQVRKTDIDCGTDVELFKALAAMNDENDLYQAFIDDDGNFAISNSAIAGIKSWEAVRFATPRKATAEEIIEHFKNK